MCNFPVLSTPLSKPCINRSKISVPKTSVNDISYLHILIFTSMRPTFPSDILKETLMFRFDLQMKSFSLRHKSDGRVGVGNPFSLLSHMRPNEHKVSFTSLHFRMALCKYLHSHYSFSAKKLLFTCMQELFEGLY